MHFCAAVIGVIASDPAQVEAYGARRGAVMLGSTTAVPPPPYSAGAGAFAGGAYMGTTATGYPAASERQPEHVLPHMLGSAVLSNTLAAESCHCASL